jgi:ssDNA-specific exonuclease RecJ
MRGESSFGENSNVQNALEMVRKFTKKGEPVEKKNNELSMRERTHVFMENMEEMNTRLNRVFVQNDIKESFQISITTPLDKWESYYANIRNYQSLNIDEKNELIKDLRKLQEEATIIIEMREEL